MQYDSSSSATKTETRAYESWRNKYAKEPDRCTSYETLRVKPTGRRIQNWLDCRMVMRALRGLPKGSSVLDIPCGGGRISRALTAAGYKSVSADYAHSMALESLPAARSATRADATRLPFRDGAFDAAVCFRFMQAVPHEIRLNVIRELGRVARLVLINYHCALSLRGVVRQLTGGKNLRNRLTEPQAMAEVVGAGLTTRRCEYKMKFWFEDFLVLADGAPATAL